MKTDRILRAVRWCALALAVVAMPAFAAGESLIDPNTFRGPAADTRAYRTGDVLTVLVLETTRARSQATTDTKRGTGLGVDFSSPSAGSYNADLGVRTGHQGTGGTSRIGELRAQITVRVVGVEENGLMRIAGTQALVVNGETQHIALSGLVRPEDVTAENTVWSSRIADADVSLAGKGVVTESQKRSIITRVLSWLGLP